MVRLVKDITRLNNESSNLMGKIEEAVEIPNSDFLALENAAQPK